MPNSYWKRRKSGLATPVSSIFERHGIVSPLVVGGRDGTRGIKYEVELARSRRLLNQMNGDILI